jgi:hypothetical protein
MRRLRLTLNNTADSILQIGDTVMNEIAQEPSIPTGTGELPVFQIDARSIPEAYYEALKAVHFGGHTLRTQYDRRNPDGTFFDPPGKDAKVSSAFANRLPSRAFPRSATASAASTLPNSSAPKIISLFLIASCCTWCVQGRSSKRPSGPTVITSV